MKHNFLGFPVPSDNSAFLFLIGLHIFLGLCCVISGIAAMLSKKGGRRHILFGKIYFWGMSVLFVSVIILSILRWPVDNELLGINVFAYSLVLGGRIYVRQVDSPLGTRIHTVCMGFSYVLLITAFYVDNGRNLPFWKLFPQWFFWVFPSIIGIPIILFAFFNHRLNRKSSMNP